ncbi:FAD dependent oxidoreductase [Athelia psychrophila]|uniref:FAD dependent oxidoreductase n=1 Tax=Athelia psychrophila TaxID=1759441 RepID=A0A166IDU7_9AGAM|nr:FAD dependent oxidoreductase [Fibularhizoctonia sp. CBS 109695]
MPANSLLLLGLAALAMSVTVPLNQAVIEQAVLHRPTPHGPAKLPVPNPSKSFWIDSSPDPSPLRLEGSSGALTDDADVCIIGSGITGKDLCVGAAYHLSQAVATNQLEKGLKVVILEAREFCSGATGRNGGHLTPATYRDFYGLQQMYGTDQALRSLAIENYTVSSLLSIIESEGLADSVNLAALGHNSLLLNDLEVAQAQVDLQAAQAAGVDVSQVEWLDAEQMNKLYGTPFPGFRFPGHNLWPLKLVTQLYLLAKSRTPDFSSSLHTRTPVTSISPASANSSSNSSRRYTLDTPRGQIKCSNIIHATNAHASHLLPQLTGADGIIPTRGQVMALRAAVSRDELGTSGWGGNEGFEYWFPMPATRKMEEGEVEANPLTIIGGGREVASPQFELYEEDDSVVNKDVSRALTDFLPNLFEGRYEKGRTAEMEWSGIMAMTRIHDPFVGPVLDPEGEKDLYQGQFIAAGYSGHGMPRAFSCAEVVADMIVAELADKQWSMPEWLPSRYLTWNRPHAK